MKNIKKRIYLFMVVGVLTLVLGCPGASDPLAPPVIGPPASESSESAKSGLPAPLSDLAKSGLPAPLSDLAKSGLPAPVSDLAESDPLAPPVKGAFSFSDENIATHHYYVKLTYNKAATLTMLISESSSPPALGTANEDAQYVRKFSAGQTRPIYIGWTDKYTHASFRTIQAQSSFYTISGTAFTRYDFIPWLMKRNTQYYLHIYGGESPGVRAFKTPDYPANLTAAQTMYSGGIVHGYINGSTISLNVERKITEPIMNTMLLVDGAYATIMLLKNSKNVGSLLTGSNTHIGGRTDTNDLLIRFKDHSVASTTAFVLEDLFYIYGPNKEANSLGFLNTYHHPHTREAHITVVTE